MDRPVIIGIVGASKGVLARATELATKLGGKIAESGAILLTGGTGGTTKVKDAAVDGAKGGRIISILGKGQGHEFRSDRHFVLSVPLGDARNVLNGFAADVLIAVPGGVGTLTEVAFAAIAGRPVIFLDSREGLAEFTASMADIASQAVHHFDDRRFAEANLREAVKPLLENAANDAASPEDAIDRAMGAKRTGAIPAIPAYPWVAKAYADALATLCSRSPN
jgi:uncharacterized protein (TIGR00725 family)